MSNVFTKSAFRLFRKYIVRLISIAAIVMVSIGLMSGIGEVEGRIKLAENTYYVTHNTSDIWLKSKNTGDFTVFPPVMPGFSAEEIEQLEEKFGKENVNACFFDEEKTDENIVRVISSEFENAKVNKLEILEGAYPSSADEVMVAPETAAMKS